MRVYRAIAFVFASLLFFQCKKETGNANQSNSFLDAPEPITASLQGNVYDNNGRPASNVTVKVGNRTAITDEKGNFRFDNVTLDRKTSMVTAETDGYFKAFRVFAATSGTNYISIKLINKTLAGTIDATTGGNVTLNNTGAKVALPANGVVKASDNSIYTGTVNVYASYIDPTASDISQVVPGSFMAEDKNAARVTLASYGMMAVELESTSAEKLQIKSGLKATLTTPIPSSIQASAPATIALWSVDEHTGIWKEEGAATKNGNVYIGDVSHFSFWNCDIAYKSVVFSLTAKTAQNQPIVQTQVRIKMSNGSNAQASGWTDSLGQVSGYVPAEQKLVMEILDPCGNAVYTKNIGPLTKNTDLGVVTVTTPMTNSFVTISGHAVNCTGGNVTRGHAIVYYNNTVRYASIDANGNFSTNFMICPASPLTAEVIAVDNDNQQQSSLTTVNISAPEAAAGYITACGVSSPAQYINYTLDGTNYVIAAGDHIYTKIGTSTPGSPFLSTWIHGAHNCAIELSFQSSSAVAGTYPMQLTTNCGQGGNGNLFISSSNLVVSSFPTQLGQFLEGTFEGSYTNNTGLHKINGCFRVRKAD